MSITKKHFGNLPDGRKAELYTLENGRGMKAAVTTYGAKLVQLWSLDREGKMADIITGFDTLEPYLNRNPYFGALVGRCANRISNASFTLDGRTYQLDCNKPPHHLHGGQDGFDKRLFEAEAVEEETRDTLILKLFSPHGDQGYPGNLWLTAEYSLTQDNELVLHYRARTDAPTPVNITNHSYFNLGGHDSGNVLGHHIWVDADAFTPTKEGGIPTGEFCAVEGTPMDLRREVCIGERIHADYFQLKQNQGFDINYVLNHPEKGLRRVCELSDPGSGRRMEVQTTMPGLQVYTANYLKGDFVFRGKGGHLYDENCGLCLETQFHPNTPNTPAFGTVILRPGEEYNHTTIYRFSADGEGK